MYKENQAAKGNEKKIIDRLIFETEWMDHG